MLDSWRAAATVALKRAAAQPLIDMILDDGAADMLAGSAGADLFGTSRLDRIIGRVRVMAWRPDGAAGGRSGASGRCVPKLELGNEAQQASATVTRRGVPAVPVMGSQQMPR